MLQVNPDLTLPPALTLGISPSHGHILSALFTSTYVGSLYISQLLLRPAPLKSPGRSIRDVPAIPPSSATDADATPSFPGPGPARGSRDHPDTIKSRIKAVSLATVASMLGVGYVVKTVGKYSMTASIGPTLILLGIPTSLASLTPSLRYTLPYLLAPTLLLGPLYAYYLDSDLPLQAPSPDSTPTRIRKSITDISLISIRNYIVGPITEELTFRSSLIAISLLTGLSPKSIVFGTPLWFGVAHAHHAIDVWRKGGSTRNAAVQALAGCVFQLGYTTLFGWYAAYLFIRTGSILPPLASHAFCNYMGIYLPTEAVERHPKRRASIWAIYISGVAGFVWGLRHV